MPSPSVDPGCCQAILLAFSQVRGAVVPSPSEEIRNLYVTIVEDLVTEFQRALQKLLCCPTVCCEAAGKALATVTIAALNEIVSEATASELTRASGDVILQRYRRSIKTVLEFAACNSECCAPTVTAFAAAREAVLTPLDLEFPVDITPSPAVRRTLYSAVVERLLEEFDRAFRKLFCCPTECCAAAVDALGRITVVFLSRLANIIVSPDLVTEEAVQAEINNLLEEYRQTVRFILEVACCPPKELTCCEEILNALATFYEGSFDPFDPTIFSVIFNDEVENARVMYAEYSRRIASELRRVLREIFCCRSCVCQKAADVLSRVALSFQLPGRFSTFTFDINGLTLLLITHFDRFGQYLQFNRFILEIACGKLCCRQDRVTCCEVILEAVALFTESTVEITQVRGIPPDTMTIVLIFRRAVFCPSLVEVTTPLCEAATEQIINSLFRSLRRLLCDPCSSECCEQAALTLAEVHAEVEREIFISLLAVGPFAIISEIRPAIDLLLERLRADVRFILKVACDCSELIPACCEAILTAYRNFFENLTPAGIIIVIEEGIPRAPANIQLPYIRAVNQLLQEFRKALLEIVCDPCCVGLAAAIGAAATRTANALFERARASPDPLTEAEVREVLQEFRDEVREINRLVRNPCSTIGGFRFSAAQRIAEERP